MGAEVCKNVSHSEKDQKQSITQPAGCLDLCNNAKSTQKEKIDEQILPIELSDAGSQREGSRNEKQVEKELNIAAPKEKVGFQESSQFFAHEQNSTNSNLKQNLTPNKNSQLKQIQLVVVNKKRKGELQLVQGENTYQPISVPFSVIKIMLKPQILKQIKKIDGSFEKKHGDPNSETYRTWKLESKGFYSNRISDGTCILITQYEFYQGNTQNNTLIPEDMGVLITQYGTYKGNFSNGKANGKGTYVTFNGKKRYEGSWRNGNFQKGKVDTQEYKYEGNFRNNLPDGRGTLQIVKNNVKYIGLFSQGLFEDQQGQYQCDAYVYKGGFRQGKKNGYGELTEKQKVIKKSGTSKLKFSNILKGNWQEDRFIKQVSRL